MKKNIIKNIMFFLCIIIILSLTLYLLNTVKDNIKHSNAPDEFNIIAIKNTSEEIFFVNEKCENETYTNMENKISQIDFENSEWVHIALEAINEISIPDNTQPVVEIRGDKIFVTFLFIRSEGSMPIPGPSYYAQVIIEIKTKKVIAVGLG